jgi:hypothetical protein
MNTNKIVFDLATVFSTLNVYETIKMLSLLKEAKENLVDFVNLLMPDDSEEILSVKEQINIINKNILVLENAIMCHETKIFEKRSVQGGMVVICLN